MAVARELAHFNGHFEMRGSLVGVRGKTQTAQAIVPFAIFEVGRFLVPVRCNVKINGHPCTQPIPTPQVGHGSCIATLCYCNYGSQSLRKIRSTLWPIPIFLRQLQSLFLMRLKAQHGLRITQIILRILTALQAIPNHRVNVVKCISLIHFVLQMNAL